VTDREVVLASAGAGSRRGRLRGFVANRSTTQRLGAVAAVLVLLSAPFGGWRSASDQDVVPLELNQKIDLGPFHLTIESVTQVKELPPVVEADGTSRFLVIRTVVTNHSDRPEFASLAAEALSGENLGALPWGDDEYPDLRVFGRDDAVELPGGEYINPDQTYPLAFVLRQSPDVDVEQFTLTVTGYQFQEIDPQTLDADRWLLETTPLAKGPVPIEVEP
jgi:hypothetical protein